MRAGRSFIRIHIQDHVAMITYVYSAWLGIRDYMYISIRRPLAERLEPKVFFHMSISNCQFPLVNCQVPFPLPPPIGLRPSKVSCGKLEAPSVPSNSHVAPWSGKVAPRSLILEQKWLQRHWVGATLSFMTSISNVNFASIWRRAHYTKSTKQDPKRTCKTFNLNRKWLSRHEVGDKYAKKS